jgi:glycosyltransferase involved in cell wall biosynthesis
MAKSLYICYFGVREPLVQTQVIPYLRELVKAGHEISLLTFEPGGAGKEKGQQEIKQELAGQDIDWYQLQYHKRFTAIATAYDVFRGILFVRTLIGQKRLDLLHGRAYVPTLIGALAKKLSRLKPKLLFDIRGFMPEEYTDGGIWPADGLLYRITKRVERWLLKESDGFVVLTEKARDIHFPESRGSGLDSLERPVEVIPCCVDFSRFETSDAKNGDSSIRSSLGLNGRPVMAYVGSFGGWYLSDEMMEFSNVARTVRPNIFFMVLTQRDQEKIRDQLIDNGFSRNDFLVTGVEPRAIAQYLSAADFGVSFIKPCYSKLASSPTKLAEYLASGLPVVANSGVGDVDELLTGEKVGVVFDRFDDSTYRLVVETIFDMTSDKLLSGRCRKVAKEYFDLDTVAGRRYRRIYSELLENK